VRGAKLRGDEPTPINAETAKANSLSWKRLCCSFYAIILLNSMFRDKQLADSSANVFRVRSWAASFS